MSTSEFALHGKTAIITGAGRGLGKAMAVGLASCGANVVLASRTLTELDKVAAVCRSHGVKAEVVPTDIVESKACDALVAAAGRAFGRIDIAVCKAAAGIQ